MANFCHQCGKRVSLSSKFCPDCGAGLPEIDSGSSNSDLEKVSNASRFGFDTGGKPLGKNAKNIPPIKKPMSALSMFFLMIFTGFIIFLVVGSFSSVSVRNCIGSMSGTPECSDCESVYRSTTLNGKSLGECRAIPGTGKYEDQCKLSCK